MVLRRHRQSLLLQVYCNDSDGIAFTGCRRLSTEGLYKQQGWSGELGLEATNGSRAWHLGEHQDDETEKEGAKGEEVQFSERKQWPSMSSVIIVQHPPTRAHTLQFITEQMTPWLWPQSNSSWLFFFHSYKFKPVCFLILSSSKCKDGAFTCQPLFQLFLRNYLLATAGDRTPGCRGLYWTHCNHAQLLWFAINNSVPLKSHFLQSYWMWPPTIKHPSGIKKRQS